MKRATVILALAVLFSVARDASAGACSTSTLDVYTTAGFSCPIGSLLFSNFGYSSSASGGAGVIPASAVVVIPCVGGDPSCAQIPDGEEGFAFTASWTALFGWRTSSHDDLDL